MLFATNRRFKQGSSPTPPDGPPPPKRSVSFNLDDTEPSVAVHFCERLGKKDYREIYASRFMNRLKGAPGSHVLLYVHGFNNLPERDIFKRTRTLQSLCDAAAPDAVQVVPLIWPCDNDRGVLKDYWDDQDAADCSAGAFRRAFGKFLRWRDQQDLGDPCQKRINILAHSMGARVLRGALQSWVHGFGRVHGVFRNIFLVAPDVVNETLGPDRPGRCLSDAARNVTVYYANDDLALRTSKVVNLRHKIVSRRLGHTGPEDMSQVARNVYAIDCDSFNNSVDSPLGHAYFLRDGKGNPSPVFTHLMRAVVTGRVDADPTSRTKILQAGSDAEP